MWFKCKITGNVFFFQYEADILSMKEHHEYECLGETLLDETSAKESAKRGRKPKEVE